MSDQAMQRALEVKRRHEQELLHKANVVAVGIGFCTRGGAVDVVETGEIRAL
jgi:hypothetical protein